MRAADCRHALLLTAGLGTRLRPLTLVRAKPAVPVAGVPLVRRILGWLATEGISDVVLNLHHLPATITRVVGDGSDLGVRVRYSWEQPVVLGSAGGPRLAQELIDSPIYFIVNGDTLTDVDLRALAAAHDASGALVTLAVTPNEEPLRYSGLRLDANSRVVGTAGRGPHAAGSFHFVGVQIVRAEAFAGLRPGEVAHSIGGLYDRLIAERPGCVAAWVSHPSFHDIGTVEDYIRTSAALDREPASIAHHRNEVHPTARVEGSILWDRITIGPHASLADCIVTDDVVIPAGSRHHREILIAGPSGPVSVPLAGLGASAAPNA